MALHMMLQSWLLLSHVFVLNSFIITICCYQNNSSQNIETFYPIETSAPAPAPAPATQPPSPPPTWPQPSPPPTTTQEHPPPEPVVASRSTSSKSKIAKAVAATAASTTVVCGLIFILVQRCLRARRRNEVTSNASAGGDRRVVPQGNVFERIDGNVRGLIVDEEGLDVIYWRNLEGKNSMRDLQKEILSSPKNTQEGDGDEGNQGKKPKLIQEIPLLRGKSSTSHINVIPEKDESFRFTIPPTAPSLPSVPALFGAAFEGADKENSPVQSSNSPPTPSSTPLSAIPIMNNPASSPKGKSPTPSPLPPPIPKAHSLTSLSSSSSKPPLAPIEMPVAFTSKQRNSSRKSMLETGNDQVKFKPLQWDKVNTNVDHSMARDKVDRGSSRVDQDLMEALFGYVAMDRRSPKGKSDSTSPSRNDVSAPSKKIFLLDPGKSQNIAIVLKSVAVSQDVILDALIDGKGLNAGTIERLARLTPTEEEQSLILEYKGDPTRLAAAESFLYHILKAVPSAFKRLNAMLLRLKYNSKILEIKEALQILQMGCRELKNQGLFVKLLEAGLKAWNRMNAGTSRGNAQAFNLGSLSKLSDVKSTDGKTTLLHSVVEEVVRSEGKRAVLYRNRSRSSNSSGSASSEEQRQREYITLGLPIVGGISSEFSTVKKASLIDYNSLVGSISALSTWIVEIEELAFQCGNDDKRGNFVKEMDHFVKSAKEEVKIVREQHTRVMQIVKRTTEYYQVGASRDSAEHNLQLFLIVKDFLGMVDQACMEITHDMQKRKTRKAGSG